MGSGRSSAPWLYAGALLLAAAGPGLTVPRAVAIWVVFNAVWALFLLVASARGLGLVRPNGPLLRESLAFGVRSWAGGLARFLNFRLDQILMGFLASEATLGIYAVAVNGAEVLLYLPAAVSSALVPVIVRAGPEERSERALRVFRTLAVLVLSTIV